MKIKSVVTVKALTKFSPSYPYIYFKQVASVRVTPALQIASKSIEMKGR